MSFQRGTIVVATLDPTVGHEQQGTRPCIVVSEPDVASSQRYPMICVVPITRTPGQGPLYPALDPDGSGVTIRSYVLIDQLRCVDKRRVRQVYGTVSPQSLAAIDEGLQLFLGLDALGEGAEA